MKRNRKYSVPIDINKKGKVSRVTAKYLSKIVIGQPRAIERVTQITASLSSILRDPSRPVGILIFAGPSDCGKSYTAKVLSQILLGSTEEELYPLTMIQCANLEERYSISTLIGSRPGYVDSHKLPLLHRYNIGKYHLISSLESDIASCKNGKEKQAKKEILRKLKTCIKALSVGRAWIGNQKNGFNAYSFLDQVFDKIHPLSIILFDEIEKADPDVRNLLLGIMEDGKLQLANNNEVTDFTNSIIILTTNTGSKEMQKLFGANRIGLTPFRQEEPEKMEQAVYNEAKRALEKAFPPELVTRLGKGIVPFRALKKEDFDRIFRLMVNEIRWRLNILGVSIRCTPAFREYIVEKVVSQKAGPRMLRDEIKESLENSLDAAIDLGQVEEGDSILFTMKGDEPVLRRQPRPKRKKVKVKAKNTEEKKQIKVRDNGHDEEEGRRILNG